LAGTVVCLMAENNEVIQLNTDSAESSPELSDTEVVLRRAAGNEGKCLEHFSTNLPKRKNGVNSGHLYPLFPDCHTTSDGSV